MASRPPTPPMVNPAMKPAVTTAASGLAAAATSCFQVRRDGTLTLTGGVQDTCEKPAIAGSSMTTPVSAPKSHGLARSGSHARTAR